MRLFIRTADIHDARLIAELSHQTFYDTFADVNRKEDMDKFLNQQFTKGKLMLEVGARGNTFFIAYLEDRVAGYVKLRDSRGPHAPDGEDALEIARLYAVRDMIGKGVGRALMQASLDHARHLGKEAVWLGVWEKNQRAIDFYVQWGFEKFGETDFLLGDDLQLDWLMKKKL